MYICNGNTNKVKQKKVTKNKKLTKDMEATVNNIEIRTFKATDWKGRENTFFEAQVGDTKYQCLSKEDLLEKIANHKDQFVDASSFYGNGQYNGD